MINGNKKIFHHMTLRQVKNSINQHLKKCIVKWLSFPFYGG